jgi:mono/diheme cytochrome c family protein
MRLVPIAICVAAVAVSGVGRLTAQAAVGQSIYRDECRTCHGAAGKPTQRAVSQYKDMPTFDAAFFANRSQDSVVAVLNRGVGKDMKSFKSKLSPEEIAAVAKYVKETFGATAATKP